MPGSPKRGRNPAATRARIADAALELFERQGFAETTIDQIAATADVSRRAIFNHFASKQAILFDHLVVRRKVALERIRRRPANERLLVSLHAVLRELCEEGYDRRLLGQIRAVLGADVYNGIEALGTEQFGRDLAAALQERGGSNVTPLEARALTTMAMGWFLVALLMYLEDGRRSMVRCFDDVVATCVRESSLPLG